MQTLWRKLDIFFNSTRGHLFKFFAGGQNNVKELGMVEA